MPTSSTSMPNAPLDPAHIEALTAELQRIDALVRQHASGTDHTVLARLAPGLDHETWRQVAQAHGLGHWLRIVPGAEAEALAELTRHLETLQAERHRDPLTGLPNRGAFTSALALEMERTRRTGAPVSLAILDVDDFKRFNDTYGHPCGDAVLGAVAHTLQTSVRRLDTAARLGGEEFALILPATSRARAMGMVERILAAIRQTSILWEGKPLSVTCSAGVATARGKGSDVSPDALYAEADRALYAAKAAGKNRVEAGKELGREKEEAALVHHDEKRFLFRK